MEKTIEGKRKTASEDLSMRKKLRTTHNLTDDDTKTRMERKWLEEVAH